MVRRILRRAVRYYYSTLQFREPLLFQLVPVIAGQFRNVFPELFQQADFVARVIKEEEEAFMRTLAKGLSYFEEHINHIDSKTISGAFAFSLFDTYGFPIDLTLLMAKEKDFDVDMEDFQSSLSEQKNRSRAATAIDTDDWVIVNNSERNEFIGYHDLLVETKLLRYRKVKAKGKQQYHFVLEKTPFYAESGGQVGDKGVLRFNDESIHVVDTRKENNLIVHVTESLPENITETVTASVDFEFRLNTTYNHTATHLLHAALRKILGTHVTQKGSLVSPDILRFDFSHFSKVTDEELRMVEIMVNDKVRQSIPVVIKEVPREEALKSGAMALFGEKYGDMVRVVIIDPSYSVELCGGTHVTHTGMIGVFSIISESAVAAGMRRIEALTGSVAMRYIADRISQTKRLNELLKTNDPLKAVERLIEDKNSLEKKWRGLRRASLSRSGMSCCRKMKLLTG